MERPLKHLLLRLVAWTGVATVLVASGCQAPPDKSAPAASTDSRVAVSDGISPQDSGRQDASRATDSALRPWDTGPLPSADARRNDAARMPADAPLSDLAASPEDIRTVDVPPRPADGGPRDTVSLPADGGPRDALSPEIGGPDGNDVERFTALARHYCAELCECGPPVDPESEDCDSRIEGCATLYRGATRFCIEDFVRVMERWTASCLPDRPESCECRWRDRCQRFAETANCDPTQEEWARLITVPPECLFGGARDKDPICPWGLPPCEDE